jgi:urease accessory protein
MRRFLSALALGLWVCSAASAFAHTGHMQASGFVSGAMHPFTGSDHLLAMLAVGLWAAQLGGRAVWIVPASFVGTMLLGGALGLAGILPPFLETGISLSVLLLGLAIAFAVRVPTVVPAALVAVFALFHGSAHGAEAPVAVSALAYAAGFAAATALLHGAGIASGAVLGRLHAPVLIRVCGGLIAICGAVLLFA